VNKMRARLKELAKLPDLHEFLEEFYDITQILHTNEFLGQFVGKTVTLFHQNIIVPDFNYKFVKRNMVEMYSGRRLVTVIDDNSDGFWIQCDGIKYWVDSCYSDYSLVANFGSIDSSIDIYCPKCRRQIPKENIPIFQPLRIEVFDINDIVVTTKRTVEPEKRYCCDNCKFCFIIEAEY